MYFLHNKDNFIKLKLKVGLDLLQFPVSDSKVPHWTTIIIYYVLASGTKASIRWSPQTFQLHCNLAQTSNLTWHQYLIWSDLALAKMLDLCRGFLINVLNKTFLITVSKLSKTQTFHIHVVKNKTLTLFSSVQDFRACIKKMLIINLTFRIP